MYLSLLVQQQKLNPILPRCNRFFPTSHPSGINYPYLIIILSSDHSESLASKRSFQHVELAGKD